MTRIFSIDLYPRDYDPICKSDPPKGCALAARVNEVGYQVVKEPWPTVPIGEQIEIETRSHWIWRATLEEVHDQDHWVVRIKILRTEKKNSWDREETPVYDKRAMPLPPVVEGQPYLLPNLGGDAWSVRPEAGKILTVGGVHYRVMGKPNPRRGTSNYEYQLKPVTAEEHAKRPGRVKITYFTDTNRDSRAYYGHAIGQVLEIKGEFLHVEKIERQAYGSGEGDEIFGYITCGVGHFVPAARAAKLRTAWEARDRVRTLEHDLKLARQDVDYGGNPDAVPGLLAELEQAKRVRGKRP